ncbi:hypothetical protein R3P38DRAFT_2590762 [Favolaschia claudopus]|uniref:Protein kinase domain-containing protein n=1 Tax=Favolaschia claudopus TaxID=2862362 RepID=A0AAV9YZQ4_9AGAR
MAFISNANNFTLGDGVYNNVHGNLINHTVIYLGQASLSTETISDGNTSLRKQNIKESSRWTSLQIIRENHLTLLRQIGSGPGYFLHSGESKGRAMIVKVFIRGADARKVCRYAALRASLHLPLTLLNRHPNISRIEGISSQASLTQFIAYKHTHWKNAKESLAVALKNDLTRSINLGLRLIAGLSAGINYLAVEGFPVDYGTQNFDVFMDNDERFVISIDFSSSEDHLSSNSVEGAHKDPYFGPTPLFELNFSGIGDSDSIKRTAWGIFGELSTRVKFPLTGMVLGGRVERDMLYGSLTNFERSSSLRREYVWAYVSSKPQDLATIATDIESNLELNYSNFQRRMAPAHPRIAHHCAGYICERIVFLTSNPAHGAVITHGTCHVCKQQVNYHEGFECICGSSSPGTQPTIKCKERKYWTHIDCVGCSEEISCRRCELNPIISMSS